MKCMFGPGVQGGSWFGLTGSKTKKKLVADQYLICCTTGHHEEEYRCQLGRYGVVGDLALRPVRSLSGGQKSRVVMALMSMVR